MKMVKIPELTKDGQNWKIYHVKFLEVAATFDCLEVLAGRPYEGDDWDGCNTLLCCMFMETVAPSIYFKIHHRTAHENFKYLAKCFCDNDPIPCTNKLQCTGTAAVVEMPENYPTSVNAATEQHADTKSDEDNLSTTKALTRGTEDVNDGNVGHTQDPRMSTKAPVEGTSTKCAEMTLVVLESVPLHETQNQPHSSLPLTPRPPVDGEPCKCKQEVADNIVTAGRTNGTVKLAKPTEMVADVNRTAPLDGEPVETAEGTLSLPALSTHLHDVVGSSQQHSITPVCALCASQILMCIMSVQVRGHVIDVDVEGGIWSGRQLVSGQRTKQFENHGVLVHLVITMCKILYDKPDCFSTLFAKILQFVVGIHSRIHQ